MNLQLHSSHALQKKCHFVLQHNKANKPLLPETKLMNVKDLKKHLFENTHLFLCDPMPHCKPLIFPHAKIDCMIVHPPHLPLLKSS